MVSSVSRIWHLSDRVGYSDGWRQCDESKLSIEIASASYKGVHNRWYPKVYRLLVWRVW